MNDAHRIDLAELKRRLNCTDAGLNCSDAVRQLSEYGGNGRHVRRETPEIVKFFRQFTHFFAVLLNVGAALAFFEAYPRKVEDNLYIGVGLLAVVLLNAFFGKLFRPNADQLRYIDIYETESCFSLNNT